MDINQLKSYKAIILLNEILENGRVFKTVLEGNDYMLQPVITDMLNKGYLAIDNGIYVATDAGATSFDNFMKRYYEYLKVYDIYCAVDTKTGDFAFEKFFDFIAENPDEEEKKKKEWNDFKNDKRFYDLRIAVASFKKGKHPEMVEPSELVFMSFINENRFDTQADNWQVKILADTIWAEIDNIVNTAITIEDFGGEDAMKNVIDKGTKIMFDLMKVEIEINKAELERVKQQQAELQTAGSETVEEETIIVETTTVIEEYEDDIIYYDPYWDPYYVSPIWFVPLFLW
jgi:hypothetical protein